MVHMILCILEAVDLLGPGADDLAFILPGLHLQCLHSVHITIGQHHGVVVLIEWPLGDVAHQPALASVGA